MINEIQDKIDEIRSRNTKHGIDSPTNYTTSHFKVRKLTLIRKILIKLNTGKWPPAWAKYYCNMGGGEWYIKYSDHKPELK